MVSCPETVKIPGLVAPSQKQGKHHHQQSLVSNLDLLSSKENILTALNNLREKQAISAQIHMKLEKGMTQQTQKLLELPTDWIYKGLA